MSYIKRGKISPNDPMNIPEKKVVIDEIIEKYRYIPGSTMVILNELQKEIGFISKPMQIYVANQLKVPENVIHGVVSFYSFFTTTPRGKHTIKFCLGTACYVGGAPQLIERAKQDLKIDINQTTEDGEITIEICRCVGACSQAPVIVADDKIHGKMNPGRVPTIIRSLIKTR